jgi:hypothetical protein
MQTQPESTRTIRRQIDATMAELRTLRDEIRVRILSPVRRSLASGRLRPSRGLQARARLR